VKTVVREFWLGVAAFACFVMFAQMLALTSRLYQAELYHAAGVAGVSALAWFVATCYIGTRAFDIRDESTAESGKED
jgi:hypothetical protein